MKRHHRALGLAAALLTLTGCGGGVGTVNGTVTFQGKPIVSGTVSLMASDGLPYTGEIKSGEYVVTEVPTGEAEVLVISPDPSTPDLSSVGAKPEPGGRPKPPEAKPKDKTGWFPIPESHGLQGGGQKYEVKKGVNTHPIKLD